MGKLVLLFITLGLIACSESGGGGGDVSAQAKGVTGEYAFTYADSSGHEYLVASKLDGKTIVMRTFYFENGNIAVGIYKKSIGTYTVSGATYSATYTYRTCGSLGSEKFHVEKLSETQIKVKTEDGTELNLTKVDNLDKNLSDGGMKVSKEDTNCDQIPTN